MPPPLPPFGVAPAEVNVVLLITALCNLSNIKLVYVLGIMRKKSVSSSLSVLVNTCR